MLNRLRRFFALPYDENEHDAIRARLLNALVVILLMSAPWLALANWLSERALSHINFSVLVALLLAVLVRWLLLQRRLGLANLAWVLFVSLAATLNIIVLGTIRSANTAVFLVDIMVAGLLLNRRAVLWVTFYSIVVVVGLGWALEVGHLPVAGPGVVDAPILWLNYILLFVVTAALIICYVDNLTRSIAQERDAAAKLLKAQQDLLKRDRILSAANFAAQRLLQSNIWRAEIDMVLARLGEATNSSHAFLFEVHRLPDGREATSLRFEWSASGVAPDLGKPAYNNRPLLEPGEETWYEQMLHGEVYWGNVNTVSAEKAAILRQQGLLTLLTVPIFVGGKWWGGLGLDDVANVRDWSPAEVDALKIAARTLGAAIERQVHDDELRQRDAVLRAANFAAQQFLIAPDWHVVIQPVLANLGLSAGVTHAYIFERHLTPEGHFALSQRHEWVREGYPSELDNPEYQNISLAQIDSLPWYGELSRGQTMFTNAFQCEDNLSAFFLQHGILSIVEIPVMVSGQWWGVIGFNDFQNVHDWSHLEIETFEIAASLLGLAIQRQRGEQALRQRELIMEAAAFAARAFLESTDWRAVIQDVLARLGEATRSSHVYLFENHLLPDGREGTSQRYEWVAPDCQPDIDNPLFQNMPIKEEHTERWLNSMVAGQVYYCNLDQIPESDHHLYLERRLMTYLDAPIYVNGLWWGILGLDDNIRVRDWAAVELDAIHVVASTLSSAIQRQLRDEAFRKAEREHREELERRVQERTQQLQDALREIEGVSFTASHDLRAPLRAVDGYASIMINEYGDSLNGEQVGYLQKIKQASQRMARLLDDLIRLIRYSRQPIRRQEVDLSELAQRALRALRERDSARKAQVNIAPGLLAFGDRALLSVVIGELLNNAWKFTMSCPIAEIQFGSTVTEDGQIVYFLKDNGIGFDMAYANKLFRNFEQLHQPGMVEGTGMGLATVHRIIQRHGGRIWADGQLNGGATFYFTLPDSG